MFDPTKHHRRSIRLKGYDYSEPGVYFVTICAHEKRFIFGRIANGQMHLSKAGWAVRSAWIRIPERFPTIELEVFVVMPNHIHGVLALVRPLPKEIIQKNRGAASSAPTDLMPTLGKVIRAFKSLSAVEVNSILRRSGAPVWQRNYYEHIIRNADDLREIQKYISENPIMWEFDRENPNAKESLP